jgi:hypothetical protein
MIDIEGLATGPETTILTIAAQAFDPSWLRLLSSNKYYAQS